VLCGIAVGLSAASLDLLTKDVMRPAQQVNQGCPARSHAVVE
jgi:hypothetical protein